MNDIATGAAFSAHPRLLNLGCGASFHPDWVNVDTVPSAPDILSHDLAKGLPFPDDAFDAVYSSHVLEHFEPSVAQRLIKDCYRVVKPGGVVRVVVPDLESIVRLYISSLDKAVAGDGHAEQFYDWMMLELYDQTVRTAPGGGMAAYLRSNLDETQKKFLASRMGHEGEPTPAIQYSLLWRLVRRLRFSVVSIREFVAGVLVLLLLGPSGRTALREGLFRKGGEVHQWMYDRFSLSRLMRGAGFEDIVIRSAGESAISGFAGHGLEKFEGRERKPDSLYLEARKPESK